MSGWAANKRKYTRYEAVSGGGNQLGWENVYVGDDVYKIPIYDGATTTPVGGAVQRDYVISVDNQALTSGAWVDINMDGGTGDVIPGVSHTAGTAIFTLDEGLYFITLQYSFDGLAGGSQQGEVQIYNVSDARHEGYVKRAVGGADIFGKMPAQLLVTSSTVIKIRLNCVSGGTPTTGVGADFFLRVTKAG